MLDDYNVDRGTCFFVSCILSVDKYGLILYHERQFHSLLISKNTDFQIELYPPMFHENNQIESTFN